MLKRKKQTPDYDEWFRVGTIILTILVLLGAVLYGNIRQKEDKTKQLQDRIVAEVISAEACGEGDFGMLLVANTIKNRAEMKQITPYEVVTEPKQYAGLTNPNRAKIYAEKKCHFFADTLAEKLMHFKDFTDGALYFKRPEEKVRAWHKTETYRYKNHIFYK